MPVIKMLVEQIRYKKNDAPGLWQNIDTIWKFMDSWKSETGPGVREESASPAILKKNA